MINWRDIRSVEALEDFFVEFNGLPEAEQDIIRAEMTDYLAQITFTEVAARQTVEVPRQGERLLRRSRNRGPRRTRGS